MARTKRSNLSTRTNRLELPKGQDHSETLSAGCYLVYHRPLSGGGGTWRARWRSQAGKIKSKALGSADDYLPSDAISILSAAEAQTKAGKFFEECSRQAVAGSIDEPVDLEYSVRQACGAYLAEVARLGKDRVTPAGICKAHIYPAFGEVQVRRLTKKQIQDWHLALAEAPRRRTGQGHSEAGSWGENGPTEDQARARRSTANRVLAVLTAALNYAAKEGLVQDEPTPWRLVHQFPGSKGQRLRFLSLKEQRALVAAADEDFRPLLQAALYTGSRFGPLARLCVRDLHNSAGTLFIERDKGGGSRHLVLVDEALDWFKAQARGKKLDEALLPRLAVKRLSNKGSEAVWLKDDTKPYMKRACENAKVEYLTFHELRHTYASTLVNAGVPLAFVAAQLGHKDTRMVERHYGHLAHSAVAESIRRLAPKLKLSPRKQP